MVKTNEVLTDEIINELKGKYKDVYHTTLTYTDEDDEDQVIEVVHRKPNTDDFETFEEESKKSISTARRNMFHNVVVWPEDKKTLHDRINGRLGVYLQFVENLSPFFAMQ